MVGNESDKAALLKRLARVEGQVRGIARMIEEDRYCIDVLQQVSAVTNALQKVAMSLVRDHLEHLSLIHISALVMPSPGRDRPADS